SSKIYKTEKISLFIKWKQLKLFPFFYLWKMLVGEPLEGVKYFSEGFSLLLLEPKSNQTDEGAHGYQRQLESVKPSAHLRWLFALPITHEKNALLSGISFRRSSLLMG